MEKLQESGELPQIEKGTEDVPIELEYSLTDNYGQIKFEGKGSSFDFNSLPLSANHFDGYIKTPYGDFAYQGPIIPLKEILKNIKEYCSLSAELVSLKVPLEEAENKHRVSVSRWTNHGDNTGYSVTFQKEKELLDRVWFLKRRLSEYDTKISSFRL